MIEHVAQIFGLPKTKQTFFAKKNIYEGSSLKRKEINCIRDNVDKIYYIATFDSRFGVPEHITEEVNYAGIDFIWVELKEKEYKKTVLSLQQCFPKPAVLVLDYRDEIMISTALKRNSMAELQKVVTEEYYFSHITDMSYISEEEKKFLDSMKLKKLDYSNLYRMYLDLCDKIILSRLLEIVGIYPGSNVDIQKVKKIMLKLEEKEACVRKLKSDYSRAGQFAGRMDIHVESVKTKREIKILTEELKGVCSDG